jgi:5-methyltetrahydropteroyltriglutamate--homocysteine methyltransferase
MATQYRADHVGSFLRPPELLQAREAYFDGRLPADQLREAEDQAILSILEVQRNAGIDVYTDGEFRRTSFIIDTSKAYAGVVPIARERPGGWQAPGWQGSGGEARATDRPDPGVNLGATQKLQRIGRLVGHEASFLRQHTPGAYKVTMPSANQLAGFLFRAQFASEAYATEHELALELADLLRAEIQELIDEGTPYVQIDIPSYTQFCDASWLEQTRAKGIDPFQLLDEWIEIDNRTLEGLRREGVTIGMHLCRGNSRGRWMREGGYDPMAEQLFNRVKVDRFLLEYDTDRAGSFEPLQFMPKDKQVVLGLITTKERRLESREELTRRIEEAAQYAPLENMALSPQCGFSTNALGNPITMDDQRRKLEMLVETARQVWG